MERAMCDLYGDAEDIGSQVTVTADEQ